MLDLISWNINRSGLTVKGLNKRGTYITGLIKNFLQLNHVVMIQELHLDEDDLNTYLNLLNPFFLATSSAFPRDLQNRVAQTALETQNT